MRHSIGKLAGIYLLSTVMVLSTTEGTYAVNLTGIDAAAGGAVALETYYQNSNNATSSIEANGKAVTASKAVEKVPGYENLGLANVEESLNIRETPVDGKVVGRLLKDGACEIISEEDGWYYIESGDISGYISKEYILSGEEALVRAWEVMANVATVTADGLYLREAPTTESGYIELLGNSEKLQVVDKLEGWAKVVVDSTEGYVNTDYIEVKQELQTAVSMSQFLYGMDVSELRVQMAEFAQQFVGYPYVYGGNSLTKGTDCSGFTNLIYAHFGISIPRTATTQYNYGTKISTSELKPGDLIIYGEYQIEHVGMYIGNGMIVHASNERTGIKYSEMYYRNIIGCVRIIND